ncbi:MAG TPA: hypothetical protein PKD53_03345 [Chloroflexaceae bacterium]|nr:hypothetical protein [Chloroflexaceae bacterium]
MSLPRKPFAHLIALLLVLSAAFAPARLSRSALAQPPPAHTVYLPLIGAPPATPAPPPPDGGEHGSFWLSSIGGTSILTTYGASVAVDRAGGVHVAYALHSGMDNGRRPAYYASCAASCADSAGWSLTRLSDEVQDVRLVLDPSTGHPRLMLFSAARADDTYEYRYAACNAGCADSANWTITPLIAVAETPTRRSSQNNRYFALDPQGGAAFIYTDSAESHSGTFYAHCRAGCADASSWSELKLFDQSLGKPALTFAPDGQPRFAATYYVPDDPQYGVPLWKLLYGGCYQRCDQLDQSVWDGIFLFPTIGDGAFSLRIDPQGRPRIAVYPTQADRALMQPGQLSFSWCDDGACLRAESWQTMSLGLPSMVGDGVDLLLDATGRPRMAYQMGDDGLGYAWCDGNCGTAASWQSRTAEATAAVAARYPPGLPQHQNCPILTWMNGVRPSLALDPAGNPRLAYDTELWWGGTNPTTHCDIAVPVSRFTMFPQP